MTAKYQYPSGYADRDEIELDPFATSIPDALTRASHPGPHGGQPNGAVTFERLAQVDHVFERARQWRPDGSSWVEFTP